MVRNPILSCPHVLTSERALPACLHASRPPQIKDVQSTHTCGRPSTWRSGSRMTALGAPGELSRISASASQDSSPVVLLVLEGMKFFAFELEGICRAWYENLLPSLFLTLILLASASRT